MSDPIQLLRRWLADPDAAAACHDDLLIRATRDCVREHDQIVERLAGPHPSQARLFDPDSSHHTVTSVVADTTIRAMILDAASRIRIFDDGDLTDTIRQLYGVSPDRNIIARARGRLESSGAVVRLGPRSRPDRMADTVHFEHWSHTT